MLKHAGALVSGLLRVRLCAVGLHRASGAVHATRGLVLVLVAGRLLAVGHDGLGDLVGERFAAFVRHVDWYVVVVGFVLCIW